MEGLEGAGLGLFGTLSLMTSPQRPLSIWFHDGKV